MCAVMVDGTIVRSNDAVRKVLGTETSSILDLAVRQPEREALALGLRAIADGSERMFRREVRSAERWIEISGIRMHGGTGDVMLHIVDVTERHRREEALRELAERDPLTGLHNRLAFHDILRHHLANGATGTLMLLDLDGFKGVNDTRGHQAGDQVLIAVANTLRESIAEADVAARLGGDEFALLIASEWAGRTALGMMLTRRIGVAATVAAGGMTVSASIGMVELASGATAESLIEDADRAMYAAKRAGKGRCVEATATVTRSGSR
jgi:diguanylate cyclase (GGDEF)-like protein/PAS domain S-box-containing protein